MAFKLKVSLFLLSMVILIVAGRTVEKKIQSSMIAEWQLWKQQFGKGYGSLAEERKRFAVWETNYKLVTNHNNRHDATFKMEMNFMADKKPMKRPAFALDLNDANHQVPKRPNKILFAPDSWDWRKKGAVSPVKNQGMLGDSQAFVAAECVESYHAIHEGQLASISLMEVHDCCTQTRVASGDVFQCIHNIGGLCSAADYPRSTGTCRNDTCVAAAQINGGKSVPKGDEDAMKDAVYMTPVMALVDASHSSFQLYRSGVYKEPNCKSTMLDHVLQVVGYGSMDGQDYWICRNSWGASWGMEGYILIARNAGNMCGIASMTTYPV